VDREPVIIGGKDEIIIRGYELPEGKLEALTALMVLPDVPILVSPQEDGLEVHATPADHEGFAEFVAVITPEATSEVFERGPDQETRVYELPDRKLEAFTALMVRPDIPILVSPQDERIEVYAAPDRQAIVERFVTMIHPGEHHSPPPPRPSPRPRVTVPEGEIVIHAYRLPEGKLEALTALMVRSDVPVLVSPQEDRLEVHATPAQHAIFAQFVALIAPDERHPGASRFTDDGPSMARRIEKKIQRKIKAVEKKAKKIAKKRKERKKHKECQKEKERKKCKEKRTKHDHSSSEHTFNADRGTHIEGLIEENIKGALESLSALGDEEQLAKVTEMVHQLASEAAHGGLKDQGQSLEAQAKALEQQARAFEAQAEQLEEQATQIEHQAEHIEHLADELNEQADELREKAEVFEEGKRGALVAQADSMVAEANALSSEVNVLLEQAGGFERVAEGLEEKAGVMDDWAGALREALEAANTLSATAE
jgi:hypothetical protein